MKSEERQAPDERADADRGGVSIRTGIFEAEILEEPAGEPPTLEAASLTTVTEVPRV